MAYNSIYTGQQIDQAVRDGEWYNLQCLSDGVSNVGFRFTRFIIVENFVPRLQGDEYRLVFMRQRRVTGKGLKWCIPMFGSIHQTKNCAPLDATYLPITGNRIAVDFTAISWVLEDILNNYGKQCARFHETRNTRKRVGYAIFKHTGVGTFGWQRVSNIVGVCASQGNKPKVAGPNFSAFSE